MQTRHLPLIALIFLAAMFPSAAHACAEPGSGYPGTAWTTHIQSITPEDGIAGVTIVYVQGFCFGDSDIPVVTVGGVTVPNFISWNDDEIVFKLPAGALSGDLTVTAQYGADDSVGEGACCTSGCSNEGWPTGTQLCGNDTVSPDFLVYSTSPAITSDIVGTPSVPQYVTGTWTWEVGSAVQTFDLTQGTQNSDGTWPITGTWTSYLQGGPYPVTGTLDQYGDFTVQNQSYGLCMEYQILNSGDATGPGWGYSYNDFSCPAPVQNFFPAYYPETDEGSYAGTVQPVLLKSQTDLPASETATPSGWEVCKAPDSVYPTCGKWERTPVASSGGPPTFSGRFVFEQKGGTGADQCYNEGASDGDPYAPLTEVTGSGWYVLQSGPYGYDDVGYASKGVDWYQQNVALPCSMTIPQAMHIDAFNSNPTYTNNTLIFEIYSTSTIYSKIELQVGGTASECENYPSLHGHCK